MPPEINEYIGFAVPCQYWLLALKSFFWGKVGTDLVTFVLDFKNIFSTVHLQSVQIIFCSSFY